MNNVTGITDIVHCSSDALQIFMALNIHQSLTFLLFSHLKGWKNTDILEFVHVSCHAQITCLWPDFQIERWRRWWWSCRWRRLQFDTAFQHLWVKGLEFFLMRDDGVLTFLSVTPLDVFKETSRQFTATFCGGKTRYLVAKTWSFPNPNQVILFRLQLGFNLSVVCRSQSYIFFFVHYIDITYGVWFLEPPLKVFFNAQHLLWIRHKHPGRNDLKTK